VIEAAGRLRAGQEPIKKRLRPAVGLYWAAAGSRVSLRERQPLIQGGQLAHATFRVHVDPDKCQGHNRCYSVSPDLFELDEAQQ
jgi:hypothetical protein